MSEDLLNELEAINSIYGEHTIERVDDLTNNVHILSIPRRDVTLRISFPSTYPEQPPDLLGIQRNDASRKGEGAQILTQARDTLRQVFIPGSVCLFDLLQGLEDDFQLQNEDSMDSQTNNSPMNQNGVTIAEDTSNGPHQPFFTSAPLKWTLSETMTSKKSVFVARACVVSFPAEAHAALQNLLTTDKRAAKATHNINAYRIRTQPFFDPKGGSKEIIYQDCDDDGETAAGGRLLHLLQVMDVWNIFVVVTRWYGGVQLGPDRFRIISQVAREAIVAGGWVKGGGQEPVRRRSARLSEKDQVFDALTITTQRL